MNSLQRFHALFNPTSSTKNVKNDRILVDYWASNDVTQRLLNYYHLNSKEELLNRWDIDFRYIEGPRFIGPPLKIHADGSENDIWGVIRRFVSYGSADAQGSYENVLKSPLEQATSVEEVESYSWPNPDWFDYSVIEKQCDLVHAQNRVVMFMGDRLNRIAQLKPMMYIRGMAKTYVDLAKKDSPIFQAILSHITSFYNEYLLRILKAANGKIDVLVTGDDFGQQDGLLCSPLTWRNKLLPGFRNYIQLAKRIDPHLKVMHHTCGSVFPIIEDMIQAGLDILNPIQPKTANMDHTQLQLKFGDRLIFHGGVSLQGPLRFGSPAEIAQEVKECCRTLGKQGRYIICSAHNFNIDIPLQNINALFESYKKYTPLLDQ
jgi:uroporphyrinogen decarboxylase